TTRSRGAGSSPPSRRLVGPIANSRRVLSPEPEGADWSRDQSGTCLRLWTMTSRDLLDFLRGQRLAVQASVSAAGVPQAAVVGVAVSHRFEIVFDTRASTRKAQNLRTHDRIALVVGGLVAGDERTAQIEGVADEPSGADL